MKALRPILLAALVLRAHGAWAHVGAGDLVGNVQNYSTNPFYSQNSAYNQRLPTPVYVQGPSIGASECQNVVASAVWTQCGLRNNCAGLQSSDIFSNVVLDLSNRAGGNYGASCAGYIDAAFNQYKSQAGSAVFGGGFPNATKPANYGAAPAAANPYNYATLTPQYEQVRDMRAAQLAGLQAQTGGGANLTAAAMPSTFSDLSFSGRMDVMREGWGDPAVGKPSFQQLADIESDEDMYARQAREAAGKQTAEAARQSLLKVENIIEWCNKYPDQCHADNNYQNWLKMSNLDVWCDTHQQECYDVRAELETAKRAYEKIKDIGAWCKANPYECYGDNAYAAWLKMSDLETYCNVNPLDCAAARQALAAEQAKRNVLAEKNDESGKLIHEGFAAWCERMPNACVGTDEQQYAAFLKSQYYDEWARNVSAEEYAADLKDRLARIGLNNTDAVYGEIETWCESDEGKKFIRTNGGGCNYETWLKATASDTWKREFPDSYEKQIEAALRRIALNSYDRVVAAVAEWCGEIAAGADAGAKAEADKRAAANAWACAGDREKLYALYMDEELLPAFCYEHPRKCTEEFKAWVKAGNNANDTDYTDKKTFQTMYPGDYNAWLEELKKIAAEEAREQEREDAQLQLQKDRQAAELAPRQAQANAAAALEEALNALVKDPTDANFEAFCIKYPNHDTCKRYEARKTEEIRLTAQTAREAVGNAQSASTTRPQQLAPRDDSTAQLNPDGATDPAPQNRKTTPEVSPVLNEPLSPEVSEVFNQLQQLLMDNL